MGRSENINTLDLTIQVEESFTPMQIEDFVWIFREDRSRRDFEKYKQQYRLVWIFREDRGRKLTANKFTRAGSGNHLGGTNSTCTNANTNTELQVQNTITNTSRNTNTNRKTKNPTNSHDVGLGTTCEVLTRTAKHKKRGQNEAQLYHKALYQRTLLLNSPRTHCVLHCVKGTEQMLWRDFLCVLTL